MPVGDLALFFHEVAFAYFCWVISFFVLFCFIHYSWYKLFLGYLHYKYLVCSLSSYSAYGIFNFNVVKISHLHVFSSFIHCKYVFLYSLRKALKLYFLASRALICPEFISVYYVTEGYHFFPFSIWIANCPRIIYSFTAFFFFNVRFVLSQIPICSAHFSWLPIGFIWSVFLSLLSILLLSTITIIF